MENQGQFYVNEALKRFELHVEGETAYSEYLETADHIIYITHTEVPAALEGRGVGSSLVRQALDYIRSRGRQLVPLCPFTAAFLKRHPEYHDLLREGFHI